MNIYENMAVVNPDLAKERVGSSFYPIHLTHVLDGGKSWTDRRRYIEKLVLNDPELHGATDYHFLSRSEQYSEGIRRYMVMLKKMHDHGLTNPRERSHFESICFPSEDPPPFVHTVMFIPALMGQASDAQKDRWLRKAQNYEITGTYAQTEMGHGTFLRGLETTATFDEKNDEFIIHSPTITSIKWWPGSLGKTVNHAVVMATLFIRGQNHGMQAFMVQLRDMKTHEPLPGIEIGDIGPKFGYSMMDNGFLKFDHVCVPRSNMLMKNQQVLRDGTFVKSKHAKLNYGTMLLLRAGMIHDIAVRLALAATITIRYSCVRRQSELRPGDREPQIIDYQTQQDKLFPHLANSYAIWFAGISMKEMYARTNIQIQQGQMELLPELHALSACLKSHTSSVACAGHEILCMACGGHGYSHAGGLPKLYVDAAPSCTYEGENTVLLLQTARYLVKSYATVQTGGKLTGTVAYLGEGGMKGNDVGNDLGLDSLAATYQWRAARLVEKAAQRYNKLQSKGKPQYEAWNLSAVDLVKAAEAHAHYFVVKNFINIIETLVGNASIHKVLTTLCKLHAIHGILEKSGDFLRFGILTGDQLDILRDGYLALLAALRPDAVSLVDAFDFSDHLLSSVLGRYDGQVYENLYKWAKESPLNKTEVHESYHKYMKPFQQMSAKL